MAEVTRFKDLQEAQKKLETENLKREAVEKKMQEQMLNMDNRLQEQIQNVGTEMKEQLDSKFDFLSNAIANLTLQFQNVGKGKGLVEEDSILGEPPRHLKIEGDNSRSYSFNRSKVFSDSYAHQPSNPPPRVDFPRFDGNNPRTWIINCNNYFKIVKNVEEDQKVAMASMYFEGRAALWFHSFSDEHPDVSWCQFVEVLSARFEELKTTQIVDDFNKLRLADSYVDFVEKFEELRGCMKLIFGNIFSEDYYISSFISGLTPELKSAVRMLKPTTLQSAIDFGRDQLDTIDAITRRINSPTRPYANVGGVTPSAPLQQHQSTPATTPTNLPRPHVKLLTSAEMSARREKGLCFNCDDRFSPGHKCKNRAYMIMTEGEELTYLQPSEGEHEMADGEGDSMGKAHASLNVIHGSDGIATMRFVGSYGEYKLQILIDTGSTLSFIKEATAVKLDYPLEVVSPLLIKVANGQQMVSSHIATNFPWELQGSSFHHSLRVLQNEECDIILGCDWLKIHNPVKFDYEKMTVTARLGGEKVRLQAQSSTTSCQILSHQSLNTLMHFVDKEKMEGLYLISPQKLNCVGSTHLITLLAAYSDNFQDLEGLPKSQGKTLTLVMVFVFQRCNLKLFSRYYGQYKILKKIGEVVSESELSAVSEFHPVFYASLPTKFIGVELVPLQVVPPATVGRLFRLIPSDILGNRTVLRCQGSVLHFLVRWSVDGADLCPWGAAVYLVKIYPKFHPWGQGCGNEGGIVVSMELATKVIGGESEVNSMVIEKGREMLSGLDF